MAMLKDRISTFFIFNSNYGPKEGEELKRIMYFHPSNVDADSRKNQVGLCEAIVKFMLNFTADSCESMITDNKKTVLFQAEKDFYMVITVKHGPTTASTSMELRGEQIPVPVIKNLLVSAYEMFQLFMGRLTDITLEDIYKKCEMFFTPYLLEMVLKDNIKDVIQGIEYLPLDKTSFFKVVCLIDLLAIEYPQLKCIAFLYNDKIIWNNLVPQDLQTVYRYLVFRLIPKQVEKELEGGAVASAQALGRYVSPAGGLTTEQDLKCIHRIHLHSENDDQDIDQRYFVVYRALCLTVCFTLDGDTDLSLNTFRSLDAFVGPHLSSVASHVGDQVASQALQNSMQNSSLADLQFVYFNRLNLAFKSSLDTNKLTASSLVKPDILNVISEMHEERKCFECAHGEVVIKTTDDYWITGKTSNEREFYVVIQQKNANLKEISDEVRRVCDAQMKGIFFYPK